MKNFKNKIFNLVKYIEKNVRNIFKLYGTTYYSQAGEDSVLASYFNEKKHGFYVDVGAHHPFHFSNTYYFYKKGWRGINIDAAPGSMKLFRRYRAKDINLEIPVAENPGELTFYELSDPLQSTFSPELYKERVGPGRCRLIQTYKLKTKTLTELLDAHCKDKINIDFLNIDVEGLDFEVIRSIDFLKYRPHLIIFEVLFSEWNEINVHPIVTFLKSKNYQLLYKLPHGLVMKSSS